LGADEIGVLEIGAELGAELGAEEGVELGAEDEGVLEIGAEEGILEMCPELDGAEETGAGVLVGPDEGALLGVLDVVVVVVGVLEVVDVLVQ
jgi:hypothetical protein